jgi:hypothetical protein
MLIREGNIEQEPLLQPSQPTSLHAYSESAQHGQTPMHTDFMAQQQHVAHGHPVLAQPAPTAGDSRPASPTSGPTGHHPHADSAQVLSTPLSLSGALESARLAKHEDALRELGWEMLEDLQDLEDQDLVELGLKKVEIARLRRLPSQLVGSE